jgi:hypothetical protein
MRVSQLVDEHRQQGQVEQIAGCVCQTEAPCRPHDVAAMLKRPVAVAQEAEADA